MGTDVDSKSYDIGLTKLTWLNLLKLAKSYPKSQHENILPRAIAKPGSKGGKFTSRS